MLSSSRSSPVRPAKIGSTTDIPTSGSTLSRAAPSREDSNCWSTCPPCSTVRRYHGSTRLNEVTDRAVPRVLTVDPAADADSGAAELADEQLHARASDASLSQLCWCHRSVIEDVP